MMKININSVIAGIHRTKVGSHPSIELRVEADDTIPDIDPLHGGPYAVKRPTSPTIAESGDLP